MIKNNKQTLYEALRQNRLYYINMATKTQTSLTLIWGGGGGVILPPQLDFP